MIWDEFIDKGTADDFVGQVQTDVDCPRCGRKIYFDGTVVLTTYPAKYCYWCRCGWTGTTAVKWRSDSND